MHLRNLVIGSAIATAAALTLVPAAQAHDPGGPIAAVAVDGDTTTADYGTTLTLEPGTSITMKIYGSDTKLGCASASVTGEVHAGSPAPSPFMTFDSLTAICDAFIPGQAVTIGVPTNGCANITLDDDHVHTGYAPSGTVDTGPTGGKVSVVDGSFNLFPPCVLTVVVGICTITIGGSTEAQFDEYIKATSPVAQELILKGTGLELLSVSPLCFGMVSVGDTISLDNVRFRVTLDGGAGPIDVRDTP